MHLYLGTANVKEIRETARLVVLNGVTTNSSLVAKEGHSFREALIEICHLGNGPVSAEVVSVEERAMAKEGEELGKIQGGGWLVSSPCAEQLKESPL